MTSEIVYDCLLKGGSRGRVQGVRTPPPEMTCGFLINTVQSASQLYKICFIIWYVFSAVHIMLLPSRKPSSSYSLLKFVYVTSQLRHSLVVHPLLRKILDPPLLLLCHNNCMYRLVLFLERLKNKILTFYPTIVAYGLKFSSSKWAKVLVLCLVHFRTLRERRTVSGFYLWM